jgi:hypothetical protein
MRKLGTVAPMPHPGGSSLSTSSTHHVGPVGKEPLGEGESGDPRPNEPKAPGRRLEYVFAREVPAGGEPVRERGHERKRGLPRLLGAPPLLPGARRPG